MENCKCKRSKYAPEFKDEAVKQVIDKGHSVVDVAKRLGITEGVLYTWVALLHKSDWGSVQQPVMM